MDPAHAVHTVLHTAPTLPYDPVGPSHAQRADYLKLTTIFFSEQTFCSRSSGFATYAFKFLSLYRLNKFMFPIAFHIHRCFLSVPHFLVTTLKKKKDLRWPFLVSVACLNAKEALLNAESVLCGCCNIYIPQGSAAALFFTATKHL